MKRILFLSALLAFLSCNKAVDSSVDITDVDATAELKEVNGSTVIATITNNSDSSIWISEAECDYALESGAVSSGGYEDVEINKEISDNASLDIQICKVPESIDEDITLEDITIKSIKGRVSNSQIVFNLSVLN